MKVWEIAEQTGIESLRMVERENPIAMHGQAVLSVKACALNHRDLKIARDDYGPPKPETRIPLADVAAEVISVGEGVAHVKPGDHVGATHFSGWVNGDYSPEAAFAADLGNTADGVLGERIVLPAHCLFKLPKNLSLIESSTLGAAGATVWSTVQRLGKIKAGDTVLSLGTGGVSVFAMQIAKMNGARAVITSSSDEKLERMRALGADVTVNYRSNPEWEKEVLEKTGGVDIVVETVGGTLDRSMSCCAPNARVGLIGALDSGQPKLNGLLAKNIVLKGITSGSREMLEEFVDAIEVGGFKPVVDRVFEFDQVQDAYRYLESGSHIGKVVIRVS